ARGLGRGPRHRRGGGDRGLPRRGGVRRRAGGQGAAGRGRGAAAQHRRGVGAPGLRGAELCRGRGGVVGAGPAGAAGWASGGGGVRAARRVARPGLRYGLALALLLLVAAPLQAAWAQEAAADGPESCRLGVSIEDIYTLDVVGDTFGASLWIWSLCPTPD